MTIITRNPRQDRALERTTIASSTIDRSRGPGAGSPVRPSGVEAWFDAEYSEPRASLRTVAVIFLAIAAAQVGVLAASAVTFDLSTFRLVLALTVIAPAVLYTIVAAWDHRQLTESGDLPAPRWAWALVFPPAYLAIRFLRVRRSRRSRTAALAWAVAQVLLSAAFVVFAATAFVTSPQQAAGAVAVEDTDVTAETVASQVELGWADAGGSGAVSCPEPVSQAPGTRVDCTAVYEGAPLEFTAVIADVSAAERVVIERWSVVPPG